MVPSLSTKEALLQSFIHQDYCFFGRAMQPFCLRHLILLMALKSPLLEGGPIKREDLRLVALVCSTKSNADFFKAARFEGIYWRLWKHVTKYMPLAPAIRAFDNYFRDNVPAFPFWETSGGVEMKMPSIFVVAARMLSSFTRDEIMSMPLGELLAWHHASREGSERPNDNLMSDFEVDILRSNPAFAEAM